VACFIDIGFLYVEVLLMSLLKHDIGVLLMAIQLIPVKLVVTRICSAEDLGNLLLVGPDS
jgi:hypothetical protein